MGYGVHYVLLCCCWRPGGGGVAGRQPWPVAFGLGMGLTLLFAFGLPPVLQLAGAAAARDPARHGRAKPASLAVLGLGVAGFAALLLAASSDVLLGAIAVGGLRRRCWCLPA